MKRIAGRTPRVEVRSRQALRDWLAAHHTQPSSIWLVSYKKTAGAHYLPYEAIVEEALAFGWVDSLPRQLDALRTMHLLAPRKPGSAWSRINKRRIARLSSQGRMHAAGLAAVARAKSDGSWNRLDRVEALEIPQDLAVALRRSRAASTHFDAFPRSSKRLILEWITQAKQPQTRAARIRETVEQAKRGLRAHHYRQPRGSR